MLKMVRLSVATALLALLSCSDALAMASRPRGLTMLVVPARYSVLQVSFDLLQRKQAVLVAYQGDATTSDPLLHAWNGSEWVHVSLERYQEASFLQVTPTQVVLVGDESMVPPVLLEASSWSPNVMSLPSIETADLVNSFGQLFRFGRSDWAWFAGRYNLELADLNEGRRKQSWYDQPYVREPGAMAAPNAAGLVVGEPLPPEPGPEAVEPEIPEADVTPPAVDSAPVPETMSAPAMEEAAPDAAAPKPGGIRLFGEDVPPAEVLPEEAAPVLQP